jgi:V/A-type H+-transporting ATPase subunit I
VTLELAAVGLSLGVLVHAVDLSLGLVSPVIAALRLHCLEFLEELHEAGRRGYAPLALPR